MLWHSSNVLKSVRYHLLYFILLIFLFIIYSKIRCPIFSIFRIKCPTCNMTRSVICLIRGNYIGYIRNNAMTIPVIISVLLEIHSPKLKSKKVIDVLCISIIVLNLIYYFIRLYNNCIPL